MKAQKSWRSNSRELVNFLMHLYFSADRVANAIVCGAEIASETHTVA